MAKPGYIISAYRRPELLVRLVSALGDAPISIHVDAKSSIFDEVQRRIGGQPNVTMLPRHMCHWGLFGHVQASLEGLRWLQGTACSHAILLTGQCYPLMSQDGIAQELAELGGRSRMSLEPFPIHAWGRSRGYSRLDRFHFKFGAKQHPRALKLFRRQVPLGMHPYGGGGYWCMARQHADYVLDFLARHPSVLRYFSSTLVPDEIFFHTILGNSPHLADIDLRAMNFQKWLPNRPNPDLLEIEDIGNARASGAWFARKFENEAVLDALDRQPGAEVTVNASSRP